MGELKDDQIGGLSFKLKKKYGGGRILLRNLDDPSKYMSTEFAGEFVDELTRDPEQTFLDLRNRLRYPGVDEVKFVAASILEVWDMVGSRNTSLIKHRMTVSKIVSSIFTLTPMIINTSHLSILSSWRVCHHNNAKLT